MDQSDLTNVQIVLPAIRSLGSWLAIRLGQKSLQRVGTNSHRPQLLERQSRAREDPVVHPIYRWTFALPVEPVAPIVAGQAALASESMIVCAVSGVSRGSSEVAKIL